MWMRAAAGVKRLDVLYVKGPRHDGAAAAATYERPAEAQSIERQMSDTAPVRGSVTLVGLRRSGGRVGALRRAG